MRNYKWSARCVDFGLMNKNRIEWLEVEEWHINGRVITRERDCSTNDKRRDLLYWCDNAMTYLGGGIYTDEARCIDMSECRTLYECKRYLKRYYDAINASPDKTPGDIVSDPA